MIRECYIHNGYCFVLTIVQSTKVFKGMQKPITLQIAKKTIPHTNKHFYWNE